MISFITKASLTALALLSVVGCAKAPLAAPLAQEREGARAAVRVAETGLEAGVIGPAAAIERKFTLSQGGEGLIDLVATVPGADWENAGREAATIRLSLDGKHNQDVVLYHGDRPLPYRLALGRLAPGEHTLRIERLAAFSAPGLTQIDFARGEIAVVPPESPDFKVFAHAPILVSRPDSHRTDTPVMLYHEAFWSEDGVAFRYTPIFTNEDGGTATKALMARWGRTVDIDWAYAIRLDSFGDKVRDTYQGFLHRTKTFRGQYEDQHPILQVASNNNIFDDHVEGPLRFRLAPHYRFDAAAASREDAVDQNPWIYRLMAKELFRERKAFKDFFTPDPGKGDAAIADPRRYMFVEFKQANQGRGLGVAVKLKNYGEVFVSHRGDSGLTNGRTGWGRVAVELPRPVTAADIERIAIVGLGRGSATVTEVRKALVLDSDLAPVALPVAWKGEGRLRDDRDEVVVYRSAP